MLSSDSLNLMPMQRIARVTFINDSAFAPVENANNLPKLVYVHLGKNSSPTLISSAAHAKKNGIFELILITDEPATHSHFPGKIIKYKRQANKKSLKSFNRRYPEKKSLAGGYWLNTMERIFALKSLEGNIPENRQIIHIESDVYPYLSNAVLQILDKNGTEVALPRFSPERGIGSIVYFKNLSALVESVDKFSKIMQIEIIENDMELFGSALNKKLVSELPSSPQSAWKMDENVALLFDGASFGQYLFGQDPFHQNGELLSGFRNPFSAIEYPEADWKLVDYEGYRYPSFRYRGTDYLLANLHLHSKEVIPLIDGEEEFWERVFSEANGLTERIARKANIGSVHAKKPSMLTRIQIARRIGMWESFNRVKLKILKEKP